MGSRPEMWFCKHCSAIPRSYIAFEMEPNVRRFPGQERIDKIRTVPYCRECTWSVRKISDGVEKPNLRFCYDCITMPITDTDLDPETGMRYCRYCGKGTSSLDDYQVAKYEQRVIELQTYARIFENTANRIKTFLKQRPLKYFSKETIEMALEITNKNTVEYEALEKYLNILLGGHHFLDYDRGMELSKGFFGSHISYNEGKYCYMDDRKLINQKFTELLGPDQKAIEQPGAKKPWWQFW
jgi:hypothetical protein